MSREATTAAKQTVFMSKRGRKPSGRRVEIYDFQAKHLVSPEPGAWKSAISRLSTK
ncbi:MAG: hypothetical protein IKO03_06280 [Lachnospiraceae bacterium]|nr:hypothetical protein [Lachnospiraceae bacterium]